MDSPSLQDLLASCRQAWAVEWADGPASRWPRLVPRPSIAQYCLDRQGMGVPEESLPLELASCSVCGWRLVDRLGRLSLEPGCPEPVNAEGCRRHLSVQPNAASVLAAWTKLQAVLAEMEAHQPKMSRESRESRTQNQPATDAPASSEAPAIPPRRPKWAPKLAQRPATKPRP